MFWYPKLNWPSSSWAWNWLEGGSTMGATGATGRGWARGAAAGTTRGWGGREKGRG